MRGAVGKTSVCLGNCRELKKNSSNWSEAKNGDNKFAIAIAHEFEINSANGSRGRKFIHFACAADKCPEGIVWTKVKELQIKKRHF